MNKITSILRICLELKHVFTYQITPFLYARYDARPEGEEEHVAKVKSSQSRTSSLSSPSKTTAAVEAAQRCLDQLAHLRFDKQRE